MFPCIQVSGLPSSISPLTLSWQQPLSHMPCVCFASSSSSFLNPDKFCSSSSPSSSTTLSESSSSEQSESGSYSLSVVNTTSIATAVMVILSVWWRFHLLLVGLASYIGLGLHINFLHAPNGIKVSELAIQTVFEPYENSWGTMVTLRTARNSAAKGTSLLTSSHFL
ncbi:hypothetical protein SCLCIDRAFT_982325 [Scleroderma citrinum Foug A]|uniref:Uncharacterized protein n=1 Tax=Scleroderma citrinum Foug A TaxID=1036808 RepID=A0A0C3DV27_9AGAM|nr:hypothetical protein SCLCIDRAFT_982325 [Scleroderma citrinum Foug A]